MYKCSKCSFLSNKELLIRKHFSVHKLDLNYYLTCERCENVKLNTIKQIKKHETHFHDEHFNGINIYKFQCNKCVFYIEENELNQIIKHQKNIKKSF